MGQLWLHPFLEKKTLLKSHWVTWVSTGYLLFFQNKKRLTWVSTGYLLYFFLEKTTKMQHWKSDNYTFEICSPACFCSSPIFLSSTSSVVSVFSSSAKCYFQSLLISSLLSCHVRSCPLEISLLFFVFSCNICDNSIEVLSLLISYAT